MIIMLLQPHLHQHMKDPTGGAPPSFIPAETPVTLQSYGDAFTYITYITICISTCSEPLKLITCVLHYCAEFGLK